jgi:RDD family/DnaJ domain
MDDYYSLLGIDAEASVDDIRGAYRERKEGLDTASDAGKADAAKLNKAWNVLSDPYQRGRYDEQRVIAAERGDLGAADDADVVRANGRGAAKSARASGGNTRQARQQSMRDERAAKLRAAATITPPAGTHWPETKPRMLAMAIDLLVIIVVLSACQLGAQAVARSQKPEVVDRIDALNKQISDTNKVKSDADKAVSADKKANNTTQQATDQKKSDDAKQKVKDLTKERDDEQAKLGGYFLAGIAIACFLGLLYLVIPTAITGRTLGKRVQHLKVLREDGSPVGWGGAIVRFGPLVLITFVLSYVQQIFAVLVLFGVTMWMRNPNMQGLHDRMAHTIVVSDAKS